MLFLLISNVFTLLIFVVNVKLHFKNIFFSTEHPNEKDIIRLRNDLDDETGDEDACMALYVIGVSPGKTNLEVHAHHPKLCKKDQWILISEWTFFVKKCVLEGVENKTKLFLKNYKDAVFRRPLKLFMPNDDLHIILKPRNLKIGLRSNFFSIIEQIFKKEFII